MVLKPEPESLIPILEVLIGNKILIPHKLIHLFSIHTKLSREATHLFRCLKLHLHLYSVLEARTLYETVCLPRLVGAFAACHCHKFQIILLVHIFLLYRLHTSCL